jgi:hypothetical protein
MVVGVVDAMKLPENEPSPDCCRVSEPAPPALSTVTGFTDIVIMELQFPPKYLADACTLESELHAHLPADVWNGIEIGDHGLAPSGLAARTRNS